MKNRTLSTSSSSHDISSLALKYAVGAAALAGVGHAQAAIVVTPVNQSWNADSQYFLFTAFAPEATNVTVGVSNSSAFDMSVRFASPAYMVISNGGYSPNGMQFSVSPAPGGNFFLSRLIPYAPGDLITGASATRSEGSLFMDNTFAAGWSNQTTSNVGFTLNFGGNSYTGWFDLMINTATLGVTVNNIAINTTPNAPITAAAIPEPANSVLAFAGGALGIAALRRRRREALAA